MSEETTAAPSGDSISVDDAVSLFTAVPEQDELEEENLEKQPAAKDEPEEAAPETDSGTDSAEEGESDSAESEGADEQEQEAPEEDQPAAPAVKPPASWDKDAQEVFAKLPPELQEKVAAREKEREAFANSKAQEAAQARKEREQLLEFATQEVAKTLRMAQDAIEGEFAGIDWLHLQASDPQTFLQLDALRKQRLDRINGLQQHRDALAKEQDEAMRAQAQATLREEAQRVRPEIERMIGEGFTPETYRKDITGYLEKSGVPAERIGMMQNGWELTIATKAMLFDKMQSAKAKAAKKVAGAPKVQASSGKQMVADTGRAQKAKAAMQRLEKSGSIDDAVAALRAAGGSRYR